MTARRVVVVGGGISGLAAAWELTGGATPQAGAPAVTLLEASAQLGGPLQSDDIGGRVVDLGPDAFLGRRREAVDLCEEVGIADALVPVAARGASVWARGRLRTLPDGHALGIPTRFWPTARSGIVGARGTLGLARDAVLPRPDVRGPIGDRAIGPLVARKLGQRVVDTMVDPLIGGIHAGSVDDMSAAATFPPLLAAAQRRGGLMRAFRAEVPAPDPDGPPLFWSLDGGMASLVDALAAGLRARGADVCLSSPVDRLERSSSEGWTVECAGRAVEADAVVLATPAPATAALVRPHDDEVAGLLDAIDYASVVLVTFRVGEDDIPSTLARDRLPGAAPQPAQGTRAVGGDGVHLPGSQVATPRPRRTRSCCAPRSGASTTRAPPGGAMRRSPSGPGKSWARSWAWAVSPLAARVTRFTDAFPQYRVHHLLRTAGVESGLARLGGVAVAGAAYRGVGIPACIASGRAAAHALL